MWESMLGDGVTSYGDMLASYLLASVQVKFSRFRTINRLARTLITSSLPHHYLMITS